MNYEDENEVKAIIVILKSGKTKKVNIPKPHITEFVDCHKVGDKIAVKSTFNCPGVNLYGGVGFENQHSIITKTGIELLGSLPDVLNRNILGKDPATNHLIPGYQGCNKDFIYWDIVKGKGYLERGNITHAEPFRIYGNGITLARVYTPFDWMDGHGTTWSGYNMDFIDINGNIVISHKDTYPAPKEHCPGIEGIRLP